MPDAERILEIARAERLAAIDTVTRLLPAESRVSVYLFQPIAAPGLRDASPGVLWDIGPLPGQLAVERDLLYQCGEAGRTGSFLQSAAECTRRVPQTTRINRQAFESYRAFNGVAAARRAQIAVEQARHGFQSKAADGPPEGAFIHHLALAPGVQSFHAISTGRLPVLGIVFTVSKHPEPVDRHEYTNLVDYAMLLASETLEIRAEQLLGQSHLTPGFSGSALEALLDDPASDAAVQLVIKLLFAHHWFFPYDPVAHHLLVRASNSDETAALYARHGWLPPRRAETDTRDGLALRALVVSDLVALIGHLCWYRLGREFRPRPGALSDAVSSALATALMAVLGAPCELPSYSGRAARGGKRERTIYLGPTRTLCATRSGERFLAPAFGVTGIQQIMRQRRAPLDRFSTSFAACGPGTTEGHARTHFKPAQFVEGFDYGGAPRLSSRLHAGMRERTRWLCSYAIGRLAQSGLRSAR